jgi:glycosyltransferase involved in cell wall biosynthesis
VASSNGGGTGTNPSRFSVCVTTRGRPEMLDACLRSLQEQIDAPPFELLVCCQGDQSNAEIVHARFPKAITGLVEHAYPGAARNFLIERSSGEVLLFLDDDVTFDPHLLQNLSEIINKHPDAKVFGGPNLTPPNSSRFQFVQGAVLGSIVGTGPVRRRYGRHPGGEADERFFTLCNMAVHREAMVPFPAAMPGGEENALLTALARVGAVMVYDPAFVVYHARRPTFRSFAVQMNKYGYGRGLVILRYLRSCRPSHLAPIGLLLWLVTLPVLALLWSPWWLLSAGVYAAALLLGGIRIAVGMSEDTIWERTKVAMTGAGLILTVHFCYGFGVLRGLLARPKPHQSEWRDVPAISASGVSEEEAHGPTSPSLT